MLDRVCLVRRNKFVGDLLDVLSFRARRTGPLTFVDLELLVPSKLSVSAAHLAGERGRLALMEKFPNCAECILHVHAEEDADVEPSDAHTNDGEKRKLVRSTSMMRSHDAIAKEVVEVLNDSVSSSLFRSPGTLARRRLHILKRVTTKRDAPDSA